MRIGERKPRFEIRSESDRSLHLESSVVVEDQNPMANQSTIEIFLRLRHYQPGLPDILNWGGSLRIGSRSTNDSGWLRETLWDRSTNNTKPNPTLWRGKRVVNHDTYGVGPLQIKASLTGGVSGHGNSPDPFSISFSELVMLPSLPRGPAVVPHEYTNKWVKSQPYIKVSGIWRKAIVYRKVGVNWELCHSDGASLPEGIEYKPMN